MSNYYITGISGSGKTAIAQELNRRQIHTVDIDLMKDLCYWENKQTHERATYASGVGEDWLYDHEWVFDEKKLLELLKSRNQVVLAGVAGNQDKFLHLFKKVLLLTCSDETLLKRLNMRTGEGQFGKNNIEQNLVLSFKKEFEEKLLARGAIKISTDVPLEQTVEEVITEIQF